MRCPRDAAAVARETLVFVCNDGVKREKVSNFSLFGKVT